MCDEVLKQEAFVSEIKENCVVVKLLQLSACSGCHASGACSSADKKQREVCVFFPSEEFSVGEKVYLIGHQSMGKLAVFLTFVIPLVLLLGVALFCTHILSVSEVQCIFITILSVVLYFGILSLFNQKLQKKLFFTLEKIHSKE